MKQLLKFLTIALLTTLFACFVGIGVAQRSPGVSVLVYQQNLANGNVVYNYRVINNSEQSIVDINIGSDYYRTVSELLSNPVGWDYFDGLARGSTTSTPGWASSFITTEESQFAQLSWEIIGSNLGLNPGQSLSGFSVTIPREDDTYRNSHWTVIFDNSTAASGSLISEQSPTPSDTTPPSLSVKLNPNTLWPPSNKLISISANITVQDDRDANPRVKLVSIFTNELIDMNSDIQGAAYGTDDRQFSIRASRSGQQKPGRVYTVKYSATDASNNTTESVATVTVPHDQRK